MKIQKKLTCYEGSMNVLANYAEGVHSELLLTIVAEEFSCYRDEKINVEKNFWLKKTPKQITGGWVETDVVFLYIIFHNEKYEQ